MTSKIGGSSEGAQVPWRMCVVVSLLALAAKARPLLAPSLATLRPKRRQYRFGRLWRKVIRRCPLEIWGLTLALSLVVALRTLGPSIVPSWAKSSRDGANSWQEIEREWPILKTADTLLAGQSMLRPLALISALVRARSQTDSGCRSAVHALTPEFALLLAAAIVMRCISFPAAGNDSYALVGPAGGMLPIAFDIASLTLLFCICIGHARTCRWPIVAGCVMFALAVAAKNDLGLAEHYKPGVPAWYADKAFACASVLESEATIAYLAYAGLGSMVRGGIGVTALLVVGQFFAAYFFVMAFPFGGEQAAVEHGHGTAVVTGGSVLQLGALLLALAIHAARSLEGVCDDEVAVSRPRGRRTGKARAEEESSSRPVDSWNGGEQDTTQDDESDDACQLCDVASGRNDAGPPVLLDIVAGVPRHCCAPGQCRANPDGALFVGEEVLEVRCSAGCTSAVHARCFRAASRSLRQQCSRHGCQGRVVRFQAASSILDVADE